MILNRNFFWLVYLFFIQVFKLQIILISIALEVLVPDRDIFLS